MKYMFLIILLTSCFQQRSSQFQIEARNFHKANFSPLPKVPYNKLLGRTPNLAELNLGRQLFNDTILSRNNDVSCATCHLTNHGFSDGNSLPVGALGQGGPNGNTVGKSFGQGVQSRTRSFGDDGSGFLPRRYMFRNSLSTINVAFRATRENKSGLFHDGRFGSLLFQTLLPIHTSIEMCGDNPIPSKNNLFKKGGELFKEPVPLRHVNTFDNFEGRDTGYFNVVKTEIVGVPSFRPNGTISKPGRNECLAIAVAKVRYNKKYRDAFQEVYKDKVSDNLIAAALTSFVLGHISKNTPYDEFMAGKPSLTKSETKGMVSFFTPLGEEKVIAGEIIKGAGCFKCHSGPTFGGSGFASLGVRSDPRSPLSKPSFVSKAETPFFGRARLQRGVTPNCHIEKITMNDGYAPDMGKAIGSFDSDDCFKFRVPPLRNVIESYPYFHHGTARGQNSTTENAEELSVLALRQVVEYHLRGPVDPLLYSKGNVRKVFFDEFFQKDFYIPFFHQNFLSLSESDPQKKDLLKIFKTKFSEDEIGDLVNFIAFGLWDRESTKKGDLGNDISHPTSVHSGLLPSVTRDNGTQYDFPIKD